MGANLKFSQPSHYDINYPSSEARCQGGILLILRKIGKFL